MADTTTEKLDRLGELADHLDKLDMLEKKLKEHGYAIGGLQARAAASDRYRKALMLFLLGACYGVLLITLLES